MPEAQHPDERPCQVPVWGLGSARRPKASARTIGPLTKGL